MAGQLCVGTKGPLADYAGGFAEQLAYRGYAPPTIKRHLWLLANLSSWLEGRGLVVGDLTADVVGAFLEARRTARYTRMLTNKGVAALLEYLHGLGALPSWEQNPDGPAEQLLERYGSYLLVERGLVERVATDFVRIARLFLSACPGTGDLAEISSLTAADIIGFVSRECPPRRGSRARTLAAAVRSFLRFLYVEGLISAPLAQSVPAVAGSRGASLPRGLPPEHVAAMLRSCDRRTATGRRDYAVLVLLSRLGLRAGEVVALRLDDIGWRPGEILIRGKGSRKERLPLPADVGEALAAYLRRGRPRCDNQLVFLRVIAPSVGLRPHAVTMIVRRACERAGLPPVGAHRLRHTVATQTLQAGASLSEVGQLLRHRSASTTFLYAKVDQPSLRALARPWPGGNWA